MGKLINIGYGNMMNTERILAVINPDSAPAKRIISRSKETEQLIDATQGRKTKSIIITDTDRIVLSALLPETIAGRMSSEPLKE
ncbi:hypothetical protein SAMN02910358_00146 [Lachnospiraceae bacterium XBB1006]|nr:hypothetical protein SAMN02910358_00146 [Lachnospiraceae bacterium XBB1006]